MHLSDTRHAQAAACKQPQAEVTCRACIAALYNVASKPQAYISTMFMQLPDSRRALTVTPRLDRRALSTSSKAGSKVSRGAAKPGRSSASSSAKASWYLKTVCCLSHRKCALQLRTAHLCAGYLYRVWKGNKPSRDDTDGVSPMYIREHGAKDTWPPHCGLGCPSHTGPSGLLCSIAICAGQEEGLQTAQSLSEFVSGAPETPWCGKRSMPRHCRHCFSDVLLT